MKLKIWELSHGEVVGDCYVKAKGEVIMVTVKRNLLFHSMAIGSEESQQRASLGCQHLATSDRYLSINTRLDRIHTYS